MSRKKRFGVRQRQKLKRRKRRARLKKENLDPNEYFYGGYYIGRKVSS